MEQLPKADVDNFENIFLAQGVKHDHIVQAVKKLWTKGLLQGGLNGGLHDFIHVVGLGPVGKANTRSKVLQVTHPNIGSHDDDGISEIYASTQSIRQDAVVQHLK